MQQRGNLRLVSLELRVGAPDRRVLIRRILQLDQAQRQAVEEDHDVRPPVVLPLDHRELVHYQPIICGGIVEVDKTDDLPTPQTLTPGPSPRGRGEMRRDFLQHGIRRLEHSGVLEPKNGQPLRPQVNITLPIKLTPLGSVVGVAVTFHDELRFVAVEVADVVAELMIASKLHVLELPVPQQLPKERLRFGVLLSKLPCPLFQTREIKSAAVVNTPSPAGRGLG